MSVVVIIEPNHLLRLGLVHLLSKLSSVLTLVDYTHPKAPKTLRYKRVIWQYYPPLQKTTWRN